MYLKDIPASFASVLEGDEALADMFFTLPVMSREKVANAGLYTAQEVENYIDTMVLEGKL
ncbi:MAG: hypothetical protein KBG54_04555 [Oscillospiraceae bacterium]|nr:hypothetical protein [Oscillospiraceae bacterium]